MSGVNNQAPITINHIQSVMNVSCLFVMVSPTQDRRLVSLVSFNVVNLPFKKILNLKSTTDIARSVNTSIVKWSVNKQDLQYRACM